MKREMIHNMIGWLWDISGWYLPEYPEDYNQEDFMNNEINSECLSACVKLDKWLRGTC